MSQIENAINAVNNAVLLDGTSSELALIFFFKFFSVRKNI